MSKIAGEGKWSSGYDEEGRSQFQYSRLLNSMPPKEEYVITYQVDLL